MKRLSDIFRRKKKQEPQPLRVKDVGRAPLTPAPDDAELAAQALLENMAEKDGILKPSPVNPQASDDIRNAEYYKRLAERIRLAHETSRLRAVRFVAFCEQELLKKDLPLSGEGSLGLLEAELYKRIDTVEREDGELLKRWRHCLAEVTVRQMTASETLSDDDDAIASQTTDGDGSK